MADVHLGAWRYPELSQLNLESFKKAMDECIKEKVDFIIIAGDLFDIAMPSVEILKDAVTEFKKLNDANIPCYIVAGSHDYSLTGRTFIDVLEKAGFCKNVASLEQKGNDLCLNFIPENKTLAIFAGIPGKKTGIELEYFKKLKVDKEQLEKYKDFLKIFVFHTAITESKPKNAIMDSICIKDLPDGFDYYAAGHLHVQDIHYKNKTPVVYPGPIFPNNTEELEKLEQGSFVIADFNEKTKQIKIEEKFIKFQEVMPLEINVDNLPVEEANSKIQQKLENTNFKDKILILKISGHLSSGKTSDIDFEKIKEKTKNAFFLLKNTSKLTTKEIDLEINTSNSTIETIEGDFIKKYETQIPEEFKKFSEFSLPLIANLDFEKKEEEKKDDFKARVFETVNKILKLNLKNEDQKD